MSGLLQETRGTVRLLRFDNPARRNALSPALRMELLRALEAAECDPSIRSVLLTGGEEVFCAGGDLGDMRVTELAAGAEHLFATGQQHAADRWVAFGRLQGPQQFHAQRRRQCVAPGRVVEAQQAHRAARFLQQTAHQATSRCSSAA